MRQPGECHMQRELAWFKEQYYGAVLSKRGASLVPAACKPFHHILTRICSQVMAPSPLVEQKVPAYVWAGRKAPAQCGEGRLGKRPCFGLVERWEENELQSPSSTLQVLQFAKGLKEAGDGPIRTCPHAT